MKESKKSVVKVPNLRFPGFDTLWKECEIGNILKIGSGKDYKHLSEGDIPVFGTGGYMTSVNNYLFNGETVCIGRKGTINKPFYFNGRLWTVDTLFYTHSFRNVIPKFVFYAFEQVNWLKYNEASGVPSLSKKTIEQIKVAIPEINEQKRIATLLSLIDDRIQTQNKIIEELKLLKIALRIKLFVQVYNEEAEPLLIKDVLKFEQPTKYLVSNTDYSNDNLLIPVLTANKSFILGYTDENFGIYDKGNCIIFDDFTMNMKYVDFQFKVKSSAIKILEPKPNVNLKFVFEYLSLLNLQSNEHKRHYISEIEQMDIALPNINIQNKTANFLSSIDKKSQIETAILKHLTDQKQYLLQNLFI
jgi:type I restriction enzyme S subunit